MSTQILAVPGRRTARLARIGDYVELSKPKILLMMLACVGAMAYLAGAAPLAIVNGLLGIGLVAAGAAAMNHYLERAADASMERTSNRPLPSGRIAGGEAVAIGLMAPLIGLTFLAITVNGTTAMLSGLTWALYVLVYTPLKTRTPANTWVGAIAGAMPALSGWAISGRPFGLLAVTVFLITFLWQFPHFMAIAWIYRHQYRMAGMRMLSVVDATGLRAGALAVTSALILIPVALVPALLPLAGSPRIYSLWALALGVGQFACAVTFLVARNQQTARWLLGASLVYLPALLLLLILVTPV